MANSTKLYRWVCPHCGSGVNAPSRPRKDDVRRFCLTCSSKTGRLVERTAPALEKQRSERAASAAAKRQDKARREREKEIAYYTVAGVDLIKEMNKILGAPSLGGPKGWLRRDPPTLKVPRMRSRPTTRLGAAWPDEHKIHIIDYPGIDAADVREVLIHELVHIYVGRNQWNHRRGGRTWHGEEFHTCLREAFREVYGLTPVGAQVNSYHGRYARALREKAAA